MVIIIFLRFFWSIRLLCCDLHVLRKPPARSFSLSLFSCHAQGVANPVFTSPPGIVAITSVCFSLTRPAVVCVGRANGQVEIWDLLDRSHEPFMSHPASVTRITDLVYHRRVRVPAQDGRRVNVRDMLAVGDSGGTLHVLELPRSLTHLVQQEHKLLISFCKREVARSEYADSRRKHRCAARAEEEEERSSREAQL
jgi:dynein intermediate chain 3, axonemal